MEQSLLKNEERISNTNFLFVSYLPEVIQEQLCYLCCMISFIKVELLKYLSKTWWASPHPPTDLYSWGLREINKHSCICASPPAPNQSQLRNKIVEMKNSSLHIDKARWEIQGCIRPLNNFLTRLAFPQWL